MRKIPSFLGFLESPGRRLSCPLHPILLCEPKCAFVHKKGPKMQGFQVDILIRADISFPN